MTSELYATLKMSHLSCHIIFVKNVIRDKFIDEKFPVDGRNEFDCVASEFANEIGNIIDVVCNGDGCKQYASLKFN